MRAPIPAPTLHTALLRLIATWRMDASLGSRLSDLSHVQARVLRGCADELEATIRDYQRGTS